MEVSQYGSTKSPVSNCFREKADRLAHLNVYKELERFELSNSKSPLNISMHSQPIYSKEAVTASKTKPTSYSPLRVRGAASSSPVRDDQ